MKIEYAHNSNEVYFSDLDPGTTFLDLTNNYLCIKTDHPEINACELESGCSRTFDGAETVIVREATVHIT